MDEIQERLKETSSTCITSYEKWSSDRKNSSVRMTLHEAIHELRKVASRMEIEMAISERDEMALKKIPIPSHRASQKRNDQGQGEGDDDSRGNSVQGHAQQMRTGPKPQRSRGKPRG